MPEVTAFSAEVLSRLPLAQATLELTGFVHQDDFPDQTLRQRDRQHPFCAPAQRGFFVVCGHEQRQLAETTGLRIHRPSGRR